MKRGIIYGSLAAIIALAAAGALAEDRDGDRDGRADGGQTSYSEAGRLKDAMS